MHVFVCRKIYLEIVKQVKYPVSKVTIVKLLKTTDLNNFLDDKRIFAMAYKYFQE